MAAFAADQEQTLLPIRRGSSHAAEDARLAERAITSAGIAALVGLPFLLLSSMIFDAPLAVPAVIATGYLALSHAQRFCAKGSVALLGAAVPAALVTWLIAFLVGKGGELSQAYAAALTTALFAAAPAFARSIIAQRKPTRTLRGSDRRVGTVTDVDNRAQLPKLSVSAGASNVAKRGGRLARTVVVCARPPCGRDGSVCDLGEAIDFAVMRAAAKAADRRVAISVVARSRIAVSCDRQLGRRVVSLLLDAALAEEGVGTLHISGRALKGVALLRVTAAGDAGLEPAPDGDCSRMRALRETVETAGGTVMIERGESTVSWSVRLNLAHTAAGDEDTRNEEEKAA